MKLIYKNIIILIFLLFLSISLPAVASEMTAKQLSDNCNELDKGISGKKFDITKVEICKSYKKGFFDSIIILEQYTGKKQFCMPSSLPKAESNVIFNSWINTNSKLVDTTTAAVALYAAYVKAFPCEK